MPGGFFFLQTEGVEQPPLGILRNADGTTRLPRLGGMARPDGVVVVSERFWALARTDGTLVEGTMPAPPDRLARLPLLRGLVRLGLSLSPLFRRGGIARKREQWPLIAALVAPLGFAFLSGTVALVAQIVVGVGLVSWLLRGRTLRLHGAEHRAIAAAESRSLSATWDGEERPSRFSPRCGTNFAALVLPVALGLNAVWPLGT